MDLERATSRRSTEDLEKIASHETRLAALAPGYADIDGDDLNKVQSERTSPTNTVNIISWDSPDDSTNPLNWPPGKKWATMAIVAAITFIAPLASSMFAPGVLQMMHEFNPNSTNEALESFVVSVYLLGFGIGPLVMAPMSELYGRWILYAVNGVLFLIFTIACAVSTSLNMLIGFRFLAGCVGAVPLAIGGGTIADLFLREQRGLALALYSMGPVIGPAIGPVAGGYLSQAVGWRWIFWVLSITIGIVNIMTFVFMKETNPITILERKAKRQRKETGDENIRSALDKGIPPRDLFLQAIVRPTRMILFQPPCLILGVLIAIVYGYLYLLYTTFPTVFEGQYGFSPGPAGLTYIGIGIGGTLALAIFSATSDSQIKRRAAKGEEVYPEHRLPLMIIGSPLVAVGLFWYGWSAEAHTQWVVPIMGTGLVGMGMLILFMCASSYLVDAYTIHAASALAANAVLRSITGAVLPLAGQSMYAKLDVGWGNSVLGFIAIIISPAPALLYIYGKRIRERWPYEP